MTTLYTASYNGNVETVLQQLKKGVDIDAQNEVKFLVNKLD